MLPDPVRAGGHRRGRAALRRQADRRPRGKWPRAVHRRREHARVGEPQPAVRRARAHPHRHVQGQDVRPAIRGRKSPAVGAVYSGGRRISGQGPQPGLCAALYPGLPEDHQKGGRIASGRKVRPDLVRRDRGEVPDPVRHHARRGRAVPRHLGRGSAQARLPRQQQRGSAP